MKVRVGGLTTLGIRTQDDQSFVEVVHGSRRAQVTLIDAAQLTVTNRANAVVSLAFSAASSCHV